MKRNLLYVLALFVLLAALAATIFFQQKMPDNVEGDYDIWSKAIRCSELDGCLHEVGHFVDDESGWPSKTEKWKNAVEMYRQASWSHQEIRGDAEISSTIQFFPGVGGPRWSCPYPWYSCFWEGGWGGYTELYAQVLKMSHGNFDRIPVFLRQFYNIELAKEKLKELGYAQ